MSDREMLNSHQLSFAVWILSHIVATDLNPQKASHFAFLSSRPCCFSLKSLMTKHLSVFSDPSVRSSMQSPTCSVFPLSGTLRLFTLLPQIAAHVHTWAALLITTNTAPTTEVDRPPYNIVVVVIKFGWTTRSPQSSTVSFQASFTYNAG